MRDEVSVVILAAGLGTRMRSKRAKVLHRAGGLCLLEHVVRAALQVARPERVVAVLGHQAAEVRAQVERYGIGFVMQNEQLGTGHAVLQAAGAPGLETGRVISLYGDAPLISPRTLERLLAAHEEARAAATLITTVLDDPYGYGRILLDADGYVAAIVEEKAATEEQKRIKEVNPGFYCFEAETLWPRLAALPPNPASGEIYLTDIVEALRRDGLRSARLVVEDARELFGINTREELAQADQVFRQRKARELMVAGVTIEKPETVTIDTTVEVGRDTVIEAFAQLRGDTVVGEDCVIGACSVIRNARLLDGVTVQPFCHVEGAEAASGAVIGPFSRLRPGAKLSAGVHVGNFVEIKNSLIGAGTKACHLAYVGDSEVGAGANIGAGTITCNYDGEKKHRTGIGDGAFIGSNSTLVAPVEVGAGSYVAAGSVITSPVPADALALGRSRQTNKEGWAQKLREKRQKTKTG